MLRKSLFVVVTLMFLINISVAQTNSVKQRATLIKTSQNMQQVPSLAQKMQSGDFVPAEKIVKEVNPKERGINQVVPGKGFPKGGDPLRDMHMR